MSATPELTSVMENPTHVAPNLHLFVWTPIVTPPTPEESNPEGYTMLLSIESIGVVQGAYTPEKNQFYQHRMRQIVLDRH